MSEARIHPVHRVPPEHGSDPVEAHVSFRGVKEGLRRRLPSSKVRWAAGHAPLGPPGAAYRRIYAKLLALRLERIAEDERRQLATMLTMAKYLERALWEFYAAREAATAALAAMRRLLNTPLPWPKQEVQAVAAVVAALDNDPVLTIVRTAAAVAAGEAPSPGPLREGIRSFVAFLEDPGPNAWQKLRGWTDEFEDLAVRYVGEKTSLFVDLDRVGRFIFPGGSDPRADIVGQWASWAVTDFIAKSRGRRRGAARDASQVIDVVFPTARGRDEPINVAMSAFRAWRNYFGGRQPANASSPEALWLSDHGGLWRRFEAAP
jgi:hypothetical protein